MRLTRLAPVATAIALIMAAQSAQATARDDLKGFTAGLKSLRGGFSQQVYDPKGRLKSESAGRVSMSAPRLFRWEYVKPYQQLIVADGKTVWNYQPDLSQVTRRPQGDAEQGSPLAALIDPAKLDSMFTVTEAGTVAGVDWLQLMPKSKSDSNFQSAKLGFANGQLTQVVVIDPLGQRTQMYFAKWERNVRLPGSTFRYTPPKGVDVIGN